MKSKKVAKQVSALLMASALLFGGMGQKTEIKAVTVEHGVE